MHKRFCTRDSAHSHEPGYWREAIANAYFDLQLSFGDEHRFDGQIDIWDLGAIELSLLQSSALAYRRLRQHCRAQDRQMLVTMPFRSQVEFTQLGRSTRCAPGQFLLESSEEPYDFGHGQDNAMWVLKLPVAALKARIGEPSRFCARQYDSLQGLGRLFHDYLQLVARHCRADHGSHVRSLMASQLIDLLALSLQQHPDALQSSHSAVRDAHLARIDAHVHRHLSDPALSPQSIAQAGGISLRYLHQLFKDTGQSVAQWIRELRLQSAHEALSRANGQTTVAQIAYGAGFGDQAQFSHAFRKKFGHAPSEMLRSSRPARSGK
ncbi:AraC-like ligand-binding domain-containing protein [Verminephrobacter eiseniae]|uniref:AraC-like ligand-binding domain-containing protein n=1 Tax=Verminephrobacter eiseniae TaxID=364317 RepID=UPI0022390479|nr:helix-turn-helix domain-containing protein [Verminephrobacter eiseniae]MCW5236279.1 helix-turn-helix domain-containing protein [Verminephrobacter eiseniae]